MSLLLRQIAGYVARRIATDPVTKAKVVRAARGVVSEVAQIAKTDDRAHAAGRAFRRAFGKQRGNG